jgi:DNA-binding CsgD family transcriptional regulator
MDNDALGEAIGLVYDVPLDPAALPRLLTCLSGLFNAHFADSFQRTADRRQFGGTAIGLDSADYNDVFLGVWVNRNVWSERRPTRRAGDIVTTREMMPVAELRRSEMYNDYLGPRDLDEGLRLDIWAGDGWVEDISLLRAWSAGPYTASELRLAGLLLPHLRRSHAVGRRLRDAQRLSAASLEALDPLPTAILMLDPGGRLLHANRAAHALLAAADGLSATRSGLTAAQPALTRDLQAMLAAAGTAGPARRSGALRLSRPSGGPDLVAVALPLRPSMAVTHLDLPGGPAVLLCVTDPTAGAGWPERQLARLFGLTQAEAGLASDLLAGRDLRDIAERKGRSIHTVRTHLARLMAKTETGRQAELLRLLAHLPHVADLQEPP